MSEASKPETIARRIEQGIFPLHGYGIDVGAGPRGMPGREWWALVPGMDGAVFAWDREEGDAHELPGIEPGRFDWLFSSHLLEHLERPARALARWVQVVKPGGRIVLSVPHRDLYEGKASPPSAWNREHLRFYLPEHSDHAEGVYGFGDFLRAHQHLGYQLLQVQVGNRNAVAADILRRRHAAGEYCIDAVLAVTGARVTSPSRNATNRCGWCKTPDVVECRGPCYPGDTRWC